MEIRIKKSVFYSAIAILVLFAVGGFWVLSSQQEQHIEENLEENFAYLSNTRTNACRGPGFIDDMDEGARLQGSCCSPMDLHRYREQIEGLEKYAYIQEIPEDPYDIPVSQVRELLDYQKTIQLNADQQKVYDDAITLSHEGGPCCCKCWRWYAFEGLAKYLIVEHGFDSGQIAEIWDLEDGCGGSGHIQDMHADV